MARGDHKSLAPQRGCAPSGPREFPALGADPPMCVLGQYLVSGGRRPNPHLAQRAGFTGDATGDTALGSQTTLPGGGRMGPPTQGGPRGSTKAEVTPVQPISSSLAAPSLRTSLAQVEFGVGHLKVSIGASPSPSRQPHGLHPGWAHGQRFLHLHPPGDGVSNQPQPSRL